MKKIDHIDKKILLELDTDARLTLTEISKRLRLPKNNIQYRVDRLKETGVIRKFLVNPSLSRLGFFLGKLYLQLSGLDARTKKSLHKYLMEEKNICWAVECEGRWDLLIGTYCRGIIDFSDFKNDFFNRFSKYISAYETTFLAEGYTSERSYLLDKKTPAKKISDFMGRSKPASLDLMDKRILERIADDARFNYAKVAKELGISPITCKKRIENLEKQKIIHGYTTLLNPKNMGYQLFRALIYLQNVQVQGRTIIDYCLEQPNVVHVIEAIGPWELELIIEAKDIKEFYELTHKLRDRFPEQIKRIESIMISDEMKISYLPLLL